MIVKILCQCLWRLSRFLQFSITKGIVTWLSCTKLQRSSITQFKITISFDNENFSSSLVHPCIKSKEINLQINPIFDQRKAINERNAPTLIQLQDSVPSFWSRIYWSRFQGVIVLSRVYICGPYTQRIRWSHFSVYRMRTRGRKGKGKSIERLETGKEFPSSIDTLRKPLRKLPRSLYSSPWTRICRNFKMSFISWWHVNEKIY